jgi:hypothetical protein
VLEDYKDFLQLYPDPTGLKYRDARSQLLSFSGEECPLREFRWGCVYQHLLFGLDVHTMHSAPRSFAKSGLWKL